MILFLFLLLMLEKKIYILPSSKRLICTETQNKAFSPSPIHITLI